jgi:hypothetical protein
MKEVPNSSETKQRNFPEDAILQSEQTLQELNSDILVRSRVSEPNTFPRHLSHKGCGRMNEVQ